MLPALTVILILDIHTNTAHYAEQPLSLCCMMVYANLLIYYGCIGVKVEF